MDKITKHYVSLLDYSHFHFVIYGRGVQLLEGFISCPSHTVTIISTCLCCACHTTTLPTFSSKPSKVSPLGEEPGDPN